MLRSSHLIARVVLALVLCALSVLKLVDFFQSMDGPAEEGAGAIHLIVAIAEGALAVLLLAGGRRVPLFGGLVALGFLGAAAVTVLAVLHGNASSSCHCAGQVPMRYDQALVMQGLIVALGGWVFSGAPTSSTCKA